MPSIKNKDERTFPGFVVKADAETGIVDSYVSIFGIVDDSFFNDIIEPGAFKKTISDNGPNGTNRIRVLWQHSVREVIGKPILLEEHPRANLPEAMRMRYPDASGGLFTRTQFVMDVQRGREAFSLYRDGAMDEWSIGFNVIQSDEETRDGETFRHLREIRLWEYSPVTWGANPATTTVDVRGSVLAVIEEIKREHPGLTDEQLVVAVLTKIRKPETVCDNIDGKKIEAVAEAIEEHLSHEQTSTEPEQVPLLPLIASPHEVASLKVKLADLQLRLNSAKGV